MEIILCVVPIEWYRGRKVIGRNRIITVYGGRFGELKLQQKF